MVELRTIIITGMVTGCISVISSLAVIALILRSRTRLSDTFHRIMVGLSLADIFLSLALSFGTIPSPTGRYSAEFARGNTSTCDAQGFFYLFGHASAPLYAITLQLYFLLRIKYNMPIEKLVKNVEPFLHAAPIVYGLIAAIVPLSLGSINATTWTSCYITSHPYGCRDKVPNELVSDKFELDKDKECTRGIKVDPKLLRWGFVGIPYILIFIFICVTLWMIYSAIRELELRRKEHMFLPDKPTLRASVLQENPIHERSQKLLKRAFSYLAAFTLSFINGMIFSIITWNDQYNSIYHLVVYIFYPLHGLYNLIVFLWPKVMKLREENESLLHSIIIAMQTYDRAILTNDLAAPRDDNTVSAPNNRISLMDWIGQSFRVKLFQNFVGEGPNNTQRSSDKQGVIECESKKNGLNALCLSLRESDAISFSESEKNDHTSCQSLQDNDGLSVSESESETKKCCA